MAKQIGGTPGETRIPLALLFDNPPKSVGTVLPGLAEKTVGGIVAPGGLGKSTAALETCMSIGVGEDLFRLWGAPPAQGRAADHAAIALPQGPGHMLLDAVLAPLGIVVKDGAARRVFVRQHPPLGSSAQQIEDRIDNVPQGICLRGPFVFDGYRRSRFTTTKPMINPIRIAQTFKTAFAISLITTATHKANARRISMIAVSALHGTLNLVVSMKDLHQPLACPCWRSASMRSNAA